MLNPPPTYCAKPRGPAFSVVLAVLLAAGLLMSACSKNSPESPFKYPFVHELHLRALPGQAYTGYAAFYLLTEDFEPVVRSTADIDQMRQGFAFVEELSSTYNIRWTHFVDLNSLAPAVASEDEQIKEGCLDMNRGLERAVQGRGDVG